jgi:hypothetical protein
MDETSRAYVNTAIDLLEIVTDQYGIIPHVTIMKIKGIIKELRDVISEGEVNNEILVE